ncbi:sushi, von Willebrand factor type A, EGF and pentraxin domain-containing protein 1-like [Gigantopelta aegis]|uniref:sushi, von Willebrand factor type A, EGF and pentraxin domain-containing protein 1-like n=1 Tax=Gigantopelta aegis TaxID=1735272 RepID=UPI001B88DA9E|nr:sushi, von Willebrand factor type A, EGF and pentraxin domain-containing protein 1-like [Gigantopelta aegis]
MKTMILVSVLLTGLLLKVKASLRTCTNMDNFSFLRRNKKIMGRGIDVIEDTGLVECAAECKLRKKCKSLSFVHSSGRCLLYENAIGQGGNAVFDSLGTDISNIQDWPSRIAGPCKNHGCSDYEVCKPTSRYSKECVTAYCPSPPTVDHAQATFVTTYETTKVGSQLSYTCDVNFHPVGNRTCLPDGTWSDFRCEPVCPPPPTVANADPQFDLNNLNTSAGVVLEYTCHQYYGPVGEMRCQNDATWTSFSCRRTNCPQPPHVLDAVANFDVNNPVTSVGSVLSYTCNQYYGPTGEMRCQSDGTWARFACERTNCSQPPHVLDAVANFDVSNSDTSVGSVLSYTCNQYYGPTGEMRCQRDGTWARFACERTNCPPPPVVTNASPDFDIDEPDTSIGVVLSYTCSQNYVGVGEMRCQSNGAWTSFSCTYTICPASTYYDPARTKCYSLTTEEVKWSKAKNKCAKTGFLTDIKKEEDYNFIASIVTPNINYWIGLSDKQIEGVWQWIDGTTDGFIPWKAGETEGQRSQNCASWHKSGQIKDKSCNGDEYGYICRVNPVRCIAPPVISSAHPDFDPATADRSIGTRLTYTCKLPSYESSAATCNTDGTWSVENRCSVFGAQG